MASVAALGFSIISRYSGGGVAAARRDLATLRAQMATMNNDLKRHSDLLSGVPQRWKAIGGAIVALTPALIPISGALLQASGALVALAASAGASLGAYGLAMKGAITQTLAMAKAGKALSPVQKEFVGAVNGMKSAWQGFIKETQGQTLATATNVVKGLTSGIKLLKPLIDAIHPSLLQVSKDFATWMKGDSAKNYAGIIAGIAKTSMPLLMQAGKDTLNFLGDGFRAFAPLANDMARSIANGAAALKSWSDGGGFQRFLAYTEAHGPAVRQFFDAFGAALKNLFNIFAGFSNGALSVLTDSLRAIAALDPAAVKAFAQSFLLLRSPIAFLVLNCPPLRDAMIALLGAMNPATIYAVAAAFVVLRVATQAFGVALLTTPTGLIITALAALAVAITFVATKTTWFQTAWEYTWNAIKTVATTVWNFLTNGLGQLTLLLMGPIGVLAILALNWSTIWNGIQAAAQAVWNALVVAWNATVNALSTAWTAVSGALVVAWNAVWAGMSTAVQAVWSAMQIAWAAFTTALATAWTTVSAALVAAWNAVWNGLLTAAQAVWTAMQVAWSAFVNGLATAWTTVSSALTSAWNTVWNGLRVAAQAVWTAMQTAWTAVCNAFAAAWNAVSGALSSAWNSVWNAMRSAAQAVWTALQSAWSAFLNAMNSAWNSFSNALKSAWSATWTAIRTVAEGIYHQIQDWWQQCLNFLTNVWNTFKAAFTASWTAAWTAIRTVAEGIYHQIQNWWQQCLNFLTTVWNTFKAAFQASWTAAWTAIRTVAEGIYHQIQDWWKQCLDFLKNVWDSFSSNFKEAWSNTWNAVKETAHDIWESIKKTVQSGVNGCIDIINGIIGAWNKITSAVGLDSLNLDKVGHVSFAVGGVVGDMPEFAKGGTVNLTRGGSLGGYAPGRDTVPAMLSRGEGVLTPEAVRGLGGSGFVHSANRQFAGHRGAGRGAQPLSAYGFATGGMVSGGGVATSSSNGVKAWHRDAPNGWRAALGGITPHLGETMAMGGGNLFATGGVPGEIPAPDPNKPGKTSGTVGEVPGKNEGDSDGGDGILKKGLDLAKGYAADTLSDIFGGTAILGFIGREAFEKAFDAVMSQINGFGGQYGKFGEFLKGGTKKLLENMIDFLVKKDEKAKEEYTSMSVAGAKSVSAWAPLAAKALALAGLSPGQLPAFLALMAAESGGNPNAINGWDVNAINGVPSQGLMQVIPPTFSAYHVAGTSNNILDPLANMAASANYIKHVYGGSVPGSPYANGTPGATRGMHLVGEEGPEMVNFAGGETVTPAKETASILSAAPAMPAGGAIAPAISSAVSGMPDIMGMVTKAISSGGSSDDIIAQIQSIISAAQDMADEVSTAWSTTTSAGQNAQSTLAPTISAIAAQHAQTIPAALTTMGTAATTTWTGMTAATQAQWLAMQTGVFVPAQTEMTTTMPANLAAMALANSTQWLAMQTATDTAWAAQRDGTYTQASDYMGVQMPTWSQAMNTGVSTAWSDMSTATGESWKSMEAGTSEPVNWIIDNSYNNGIAAMWNAVAGVIWEGGGKELPTVATLATGGPVRGPGTATSDSIPAMLSRGEHVLTAREVQKAGGHQAIYRMRAGLGAGEAPMGFATGGAVGDLKRGNLWPAIEGGMQSAVDSTKSQLTDLFGRTSGSSDVVSPADWIEQYVKKDDEINKFVGGPPWIPGVSDQITSFQGFTVNQRTADMLNAAMALGASFSLYQGSYNVGVAASAGTHDGGGVVDLGPATSTNVGALRAVGFAAWGRGPEWGSPVFSSHIHAVALGDPTVSPGAAAQQASFLAGGNGLADGGPDNFSGGIPSIAYKNVDPSDIKQNVVSYDSGGYLEPGYTLAYNGTGKPEPVGHDLVPRGSGGNVTVTMPITVQGNLDEKAVAKLDNEVLPKLRVLLAKGTGK